MLVTESQNRMGWQLPLRYGLLRRVTPEEVESVNLAVVYGKVQIYLKTE